MGQLVQEKNLKFKTTDISVRINLTSTLTRPVDNVVITTKVLQDRNNNCVMERQWKIKVN